jgi:WD40 repeat protein
MIHVWDVVTREEFGEPLVVDHGHILSIRFSPDGKRIVSASSDGTIHVGDAVTRQTLGPPLQGHTRGAYVAAISLDGKYIVFADSSTLSICDAENSEVLSTLQFEEDTPWLRTVSVAISPNGRNIICSYQKKIWI